MYKREFAVLAVVCMLFIGLVGTSGCARQESIEEDVGQFYVGGASGLSMRFVEGQPPDEFFEQDDVEVVIQLENSGEYDIPENGVNLIISGVPPSAKKDFESSKFNIMPLPGVSRVVDTIIPGAVEEVLFGTLSYDVRVPEGSIPQRLHAKACYLYGANTTSTACIRENIYAATIGAQICEVNEEKKVETSSGPIQVSAAREFARGPNKISFTVTVENAGAGDVYWNEQRDLKCESIPFTDLNKIKLAEVSIDGLEDRLETCSGLGADNTIRLKSDKTGSFVCVWNTTGQEAYEGFMTVDLEYIYTSEIIKEVNVLALAGV